MYLGSLGAEVEPPIYRICRLDLPMSCVSLTLANFRPISVMDQRLAGSRADWQWLENQVNLWMEDTSGAS